MIEFILTYSSESILSFVASAIPLILLIGAVVFIIFMIIGTIFFLNNDF